MLGDTEITRLRDAELTVLRRRRVGFVFQSFNLVPTLDVAGNILLPFELDGRRPTRRAGASGSTTSSTRSASATGSPTVRTSCPAASSSASAIVRALATRPDLVFADEPTGNLDSRTGREVLALLAQASRSYGQSIAMVTHDPIAASYADRIVFLADGRVVDRTARDPTPEEISAFMLGMEQRA